MGDGIQPLLGFPAEALSFGTIKTSPSNQTAVTILRNWRDWPTPVLCLAGAPKAGKTTLARAWASEVSAEIMLPEQFDRLSHDDVKAFANGMLAIDDADAITNEDNLLSLINLAASSGGCALLTARSTPAGWRVSSADLGSRLRSMPLAEIGPPDEDMLRGRLEAAGRRRFMKFSDDLLDYLTVRLGRSYAGLEDYVTRLSETVGTQNRAPTVPLARDVLEAGGAFEYAPDDEDDTKDGHG